MNSGDDSMYYLRESLNGINLMKRDLIETDTSSKDKVIDTFSSKSQADEVVRKLNKRINIYPWCEVVEAQKNGKDAYFIPGLSEHENCWFELKTIKFADIPSSNYTTLEQFEEDDCIDDADTVRSLITAYRNKENVPPIILDSNMGIIDGYHRSPAMDVLAYHVTEAYVKIALV